MHNSHNFIHLSRQHNYI